MLTTALRQYPKNFMMLLILSATLHGCGLPAQSSGADGTLEAVNISDTQYATVVDPEWGTFELLAVGQDRATGQWEFIVRASRAAAKNLIRFVWDFGNGPEGEGVSASHRFTENGVYDVVVTAYGVDDSVLFELRLTINVGAEGNHQPLVVAVADEIVQENELVYLYGDESSDPDQDPLRFEWIQIYGPSVSILNAAQANASFVAPLVDKDQELEFRLVVSDGDLSEHADVALVVTNESDAVEDEAGPGCVVGSPAWQSIPITNQVNTFEVAFNAFPQADYMDGVVGLSFGPAATFSELAAIVRFNPAGTIDARSGGLYTTGTDVPYVAGARYKFRLVVDLNTHQYDVFVQPPDQPEVAIGTDLAFRTEQNAISSIAHWSVWSDVDTPLSVCGFRIVDSALKADAGADATISAGGSTALNGTVSGGQSPYIYQWSPSTGLSNAQISSPLANPGETTTYTLTVTDVWGATASDDVTIIVRSATALAANAGEDKQIVAGGSTTLSGSASGGATPYSFQWSPKTGLSNPTAASPTANPAVTTTYTLTVTDGLSNTASDEVLVTVSTAPAGPAYFVDQKDPDASDRNPGTESLPWKTLAKAASTARPGQTVLVKAGTYYETLKPAYSGTADSLITFKAHPGEECKSAFAGTKSDCRVIIDGQSSRDYGINAYPRRYVRFEGFEIRNHTADGVYLQGYYDTTAEGFEVVNNYIHHNGNDAITFRGASRGVLVENNELTQNSQTGISFGNGSGHRLRGNNIHYNGKDAIRGGGDQLVIELNRMYDQFHTDLHPDGMDLGDMSNSILRYNTLWDFTQLMYFHDYDNGGGFSHLQIYGNVFYTDRYWTVSRGEAPAIFFDASFHNSPIRDVVIHSNTFLWTGYKGIIMYGGPLDQIVICDNIFYDSGIDLDGRTAGVKSNYNLFYNSSKPANEGPNSITAHPQFVNYQRHVSWDVRLKSTSPAINKGDPELMTLTKLTGDFRDIDGVTRPTGSRCDIGAYEYAP